jgi:hypothetical protein
MRIWPRAIYVRPSNKGSLTRTVAEPIVKVQEGIEPVELLARPEGLEPPTPQISSFT